MIRNNGYSAKLEYSLDGEVGNGILFIPVYPSNSFDFSLKEVTLNNLIGKIAKVRTVLEIEK